MAIKMKTAIATIQPGVRSPAATGRRAGCGSGGGGGDTSRGRGGGGGGREARDCSLGLMSLKGVSDAIGMSFQELRVSRPRSSEVTAYGANGAGQNERCRGAGPDADGNQSRHEYRDQHDWDHVLL